MSSIAGFFQPNTIYSKENEFLIKTIHDMSQALIHRGPDEQSFFYFPQGAFNQNFLLAGYIPGTFPHEMQPITRIYHEHSYTLFMDGCITNPEEIAMHLESHQCSTKDMSLEELLLFSFFKDGTDFIKRVRGAFAIAIFDQDYKTLYLFRDPLGLRPLFYCHHAGALVFASEIKGLFQYPGVEPVLDHDGLTELLSLGPARRPGNAIFSGISEVKPGHFISFSKDLFFEEAYHQFCIKEHTDNYEDTLENISYLLNQSFQALNPSILPSASLLSGGLDSSIVTAKLTEHINTSDKTAAHSLDSSSISVTSTQKTSGTLPPLATYSLEFDNSRQFFKSNAFQPSLDAPYVQEMVLHLDTKHTIYNCSNKNQFDYLKKSVTAHDLPAMADVDASYLFFCEKVGAQHKIIFTGECADEIFCGYPWYHTSDDPMTFPWTKDLSPRKTLLKDEFLSSICMEECVRNAYTDSCREIGLDAFEQPKNPADASRELLHRKTFYLTIRYFMQTLINRGDRAAAAHSMDARMPFAHQELTEYLFNVPFEMQAKNGERKHLLRTYASSLLPKSIRLRKKSPYPKTYDPGYEAMVNNELLNELRKPSCPLHLFLDRDKTENFCRQVKDLGQPWYGQLMAGPQLAAYYLQILYWIEQYHIKITI